MASKVFPHAVIYDGVLYPANTPIKIKEINDEKPATKTASKRAVKKDDEGTSRKA